MPSYTKRRCGAQCENFTGVNALAFGRGKEIDCGGCTFDSGKVLPAYVSMECRFGLTGKSDTPVAASGRTAEALKARGANHVH